MIEIYLALYLLIAIVWGVCAGLMQEHCYPDEPEWKMQATMLINACLWPIAMVFALIWWIRRRRKKTNDNP